jgi:hypothetical protein
VQGGRCDTNHKVRGRMEARTASVFAQRLAYEVARYIHAVRLEPTTASCALSLAKSLEGT